MVKKSDSEKDKKEKMIKRTKKTSIRPKKGVSEKSVSKKKKPKKIIMKKPIAGDVSLRESIPAIVEKPKKVKKSVAKTPKTLTSKVKTPLPEAKPIEKSGVLAETQEPGVKEGIPVKEAAQKEKIEAALPEEPQVKKIAIDIPIAVKDLAAKLDLRPNDLIKKMIEKGIFATINQPLNEEIVNEMARTYGVKIEKLPTLEEEALKEVEEVEEKNLIPRPPVVTLMGHVDHGKTSLLDMIRKTKVVAKEYGGITQHIGAYEVMLENGAVTFLDTPGHEAFTEMRARGANATDAVVLVIAADDGVKPQTIEAVDHARAAGVPIVVALNKCDLPNIDIERVKTQLSQINLMAEDWGGKTITVEVSAKTGKGIDKLLEMLLLEAELLELKANPKVPAKGVVIESELSRGRGIVATVLVKNGTLRVGDIVVAGSNFGKVKAMINDRGQRVQEVPPSMPVEILGLSGVPRAGEKFFVVNDERKARDYCLQKQIREKEKEMAFSRRVSLEGLYQQIEKGRIKELKVIIKGDVSGSIEALHKALSELSTKDIKINIIHSGVGNVNDSDVILALASNAVVIGFHVKIEPKAQVTAENEGVQIKLYDIIYEAIADIDAAMEGMLEPIAKEVLLGRAQVRKTFTMSKVGTIAGCYVTKGRIPRNAIAKLIRGGNIIYEGKIASLKRFKDDVKETQEGYECGISLVNHNNIKEGDSIEAFEIQKIARRLRDR